MAVGDEPHRASLPNDPYVFTPLTNGVVRLGSAYTAANNWMQSYVSGNIYWDPDAQVWINASYGGNNGWAALGFHITGPVFYADEGTGAVQRTYTPAQFIARRMTAGAQKFDGGFTPTFSIAGQEYAELGAWPTVSFYGTPVYTGTIMTDIASDRNYGQALRLSIVYVSPSHCDFRVHNTLNQQIDNLRIAWQCMGY